MLSKEELLQVSTCLSSNIYSMLGHFTKFFKRIFWAVLDSQENCKKGIRIIHICSCSYTCIASLIINVPHQNGTFVSTVENILTHHYYLTSVLYTIVHSWCCIFYWFKQMYNDIYPPLQYLTEYFHYHKNFCVPVFPPHLQQPLMVFTVSIVLPFPECHIGGITQNIAFSDQFLALSTMHLRSLLVFPDLILTSSEC